VVAHAGRVGKALSEEREGLLLTAERCLRPAEALAGETRRDAPPRSVFVALAGTRHRPAGYGAAKLRLPGELSDGPVLMRRS
jgi:hypothetical protein